MPALRLEMRIVKEVLGCVAKNKLGYKNTEHHFSSSGNLEEALHESNLPAETVRLRSRIISSRSR